MHYLAFGFPNDEGGYGFIIPDIPGFTADAGEATIDQALAVVRRVLADHLAALVDAGLEVPAARTPEDVLVDPDFADERDTAAFFTLVPAILPAGRTLRVNITIDEATLGLIDRAAGDRNLTRSAFIAEASRRFALGESGGLAILKEAYRRQESEEAVEALAREIARYLAPATIGDLCDVQPAGEGAEIDTTGGRKSHSGFLNR